MKPGPEKSRQKLSLGVHLGGGRSLANRMARGISGASEPSRKDNGKTTGEKKLNDGFENHVPINSG